MNTPPPFGDPTAVKNENTAAVKKGLLFGCGGCALLLTLIAGLFLAIMGVVLFTMRNTDVYQQSLARAQASPAVKSALGEPVTAGWYVLGSIRSYAGSADDQGHASINYPISGTSDSGTVNAVATKKQGSWVFSSLFVTTDRDQKRIDLMNEAH